MAEFIRRGRHKWLVRVFKGRDENGRRIFANKTITGTKDDAENWAYDQKRQQTTANPLIGELLDDLILDYKVNGKSLAWATIVCDVHLRPVFGSLKASKMSTEHAKRYMAARQTAGRINATPLTGNWRYYDARSIWRGGIHHRRSQRSPISPRLKRTMSGRDFSRMSSTGHCLPSCRNGTPGPSVRLLHRGT